jgi:hypothetical protein
MNRSKPATKVASSPKVAKAVPVPDLPAIDARLEEILARSPSPFSDAVLPNAYRETPDVPSIHAAARQRCMALVHEARETGSMKPQRCI